MPEEKATLSKQPALEKKPDAAKLPNAPPKTEKPPDKNDGIKPASAAEPQKPEDKTGTVKPPPAEVGKADASGKDSRKDTVPTGDVKKPEAPVKSPSAPAEAKKLDASANTPGKDTAPVSSAEKPCAAVKPPKQPATKAIPENDPKKPDSKIGIDDLVISDLSHEAAGLEFFVQSHKNFLLFVGQRENKTPSAKINLAEGDKIRGTTSVCRLFTETASRVRTPE